QPGCEPVTLWLLSTDNLSRPAAELDPLLRIIETLVTELAVDANPWQLKIVGALDMLPGPTASLLKAAEERTEGRAGGAQLNIAVGYGGGGRVAQAAASATPEQTPARTP